jgi:hypothetical protein
MQIVAHRVARFGAAGGITDGVLRHQSLGQIALDGHRGWRSGRNLALGGRTCR